MLSALLTLVSPEPRWWLAVLRKSREVTGRASKTVFERMNEG